MPPSWLDDLLDATWRKPKYTGPERRRTKRWQPRPVRPLLACLAVAALAYAAAVVWLITQETRLVFRAGATLATGRPEFGYTRVDLPRPDGLRQFAWVMDADQPNGRPWVLYLHGTGSTVASAVNISHYRQLRGMGLSVLAPEYRGFGGLDGVPTEPALASDARAAYEYLHILRGIPPARIVFYGWSLGGAVAVDLASRNAAAALILEGTPASLVAIRQRQYPLFPIRLITRNSFEPIRAISLVTSPILFLHSSDDEVIPVSEGRRLSGAARAPTTFVEVRGTHEYASETDAERFYGAVAAFLGQHDVIPRTTGSVKTTVALQPARNAVKDE
jgi:pimeloyl-ACP methyl ester carboxylesterase